MSCWPPNRCAGRIMIQEDDTVHFASCCEKIKSIIMRLILHTIFGPALMIYDCLKKTIKIWVSPVDWLLKKVNPNYVNDVVDKKDRITQSVKRKAGSSILTMSSFIAK